eukprot:CAMPEP_0114595446 /NCGR_PEP_ID=MMETSP0125-20121206/17237_1 /TAXON_ID=485358 ORGANISM="Aristerostoma sp., Strain ATCC 50986" /NCGR_SAMPLE_ID=MMETSP0125 /ASSEMBLY_ACC=CAM_ASM_000245 /LENGTH=109 /DNA_ID=CAMNT_0001797027 /DNA_START=1250 /DNA_END=1579 /DNA_ORIENTATION=+
MIGVYAAFSALISLDSLNKLSLNFENSGNSEEINPANLPETRIETNKNLVELNFSVKDCKSANDIDVENFHNLLSKVENLTKYRVDFSGITRLPESAVNMIMSTSTQKE